MPYLSFRPGALDFYLGLPLWQRERIAEALVGLLANPRPFGLRMLPGPPEAYELAVADRQMHYRIRTDDQGNDVMISVMWV